MVRIDYEVLYHYVYDKVTVLTDANVEEKDIRALTSNLSRICRSTYDKETLHTMFISKVMDLIPDADVAVADQMARDILG